MNRSHYVDGKCRKCNLPPTEEGHDPCIGTIPKAMNACCGHGNKFSAYIQYPLRVVANTKMVNCAGTKIRMLIGLKASKMFKIYKLIIPVLTKRV